MSASPTPRSGRGKAGVLVISRSLGEGFSIGDTWRFKVADINAQYVTLEVSDGTNTWSCQLEADGCVQIDEHDTPNVKAIGRPVGVQVMRVTSNDARLAVRAPRTLKIRRDEHDATSGIGAL